MNKTGETVSKIDERAVRLNILNLSIQNGSNLNCVDTCLSFLILLCAKRFDSREDQTSLLFINFADNYLNFLAEISIQVIDMSECKAGRRNKSADTFNIGDNTFIDYTVNRDGKGSFLCLILF